MMAQTNLDPSYVLNIIDSSLTCSAMDVALLTLLIIVVLQNTDHKMSSMWHSQSVHACQHSKPSCAHICGL